MRLSEQAQLPHDGLRPLVAIPHNRFSRGIKIVSGRHKARVALERAGCLNQQQSKIAQMNYSPSPFDAEQHLPNRLKVFINRLTGDGVDYHVQEGSSTRGYARRMRRYGQSAITMLSISTRAEVDLIIENMRSASFLHAP
jgi:hypothetical protein